MRIPDQALQQHIAVLGKTGSGKTFAVKGIVEHLLELGRRVAIVDPTGAWWGLRSSRDGKGPGYPILVLGGDHGDLPLPALGGAAVARLLAQGVNLVADTSLLSVGERTRWFLDFASELYRTNRAPLHLVLDEAHNFAPQGGGQARDPDTGKMLHAANTLASGGRSRGIRLAMITQRPQKLHKDALTSADTLIAMRVLAPQDRKAVEDWIRGCGDEGHGKMVLDSLASLKRGEGWAWYPEGGFFERITFPPIRTFDSSATPTDGGVVATPKRAAEVDLTEIRAALAQAVEEAEANDPKALRAEVAKLRQQLAEKAPAQELDASVVDDGALDAARQQAYAEGRRDGFADALLQVQPIADRLDTLGGSIADTISSFRADLERLTSKAADNIQRLPERSPAATHVAPAPRTPAAATRQPRGDQAAATTDLPRGERLVLTAIAQHRAGVTREQITVLTGYKRSTRDLYLQGLQRRGFMRIEGSTILATPEGVTALGDDFKPLPKGAALRTYWLERLPEGERKVLEVITDAWPGIVERDHISERTGYKRSTRDLYLQKLARRQLITAERGAARASDVLFK